MRQEYALASPYILSVGTVHPRKNYVRLIEALALLPAVEPLVIVGKKGWLGDSITGTRQELKLQARVKFLDYAPQQDMAALYAGASLVALPSLYEGFGFPALEAQVCGTPLVCSNTSSLPEVAGDGRGVF